jgi:predicted phosphodiesterase
MICPKCNGKANKYGKEIYKNSYARKYRCTECNYVWRVPVEEVQIQGITAEERTDFEGDIMPYLKTIGRKAKEKTELEKRQVITMPNRPFAIALLSDIHGGGKTDYEALEQDIKIIESTDDMYVGNAGDDTDNFVYGKLQFIQREQPTTFDMEVRFLEWLADKLKPHLLFWLSGNHNVWTKKASGIDFIRGLLQNEKCLYDTAQMAFTLKWGDHQQKWMVRHKWKYTSVFNPTHGLEVGWERIGENYDVAVGGHTHIATLCREFVKEEQKRFAILLGTYKIRDNFAREMGFARSYGTGSGAMVYNTDGRSFWCDDLMTARDVLEMWSK